MSREIGLRVSKHNIRATYDGEFISFDDFVRLCDYDLHHLYADKGLCKKIIECDSDILASNISNIHDFIEVIPDSFIIEDKIQYVSVELVKHIASLDEKVDLHTKQFIKELQRATIAFNYGKYAIIGVIVLIGGLFALIIGIIAGLFGKLL